MNFKKFILPTAAAASLLFSTDTQAQIKEPDLQKIEMSLRDQEKGLTAQQKEAWALFKETKEFQNIFPEILQRVKLDKISSNPRMIYIPGDTFTIMVYKPNKTVRMHPAHITPEIFIPKGQALDKYNQVSASYVVRPKGAQANADVDLLYQNVNDKIHYLVGFTKPDTKNNPYQYNLTGSFIETPLLYAKEMSKEQLAKIGLNESEEETKINNVLGRALTKEQILELEGTTAYCQYWFAPLSHYSVGKRAHNFYAVAQAAPLTEAEKTQVQNAINEVFAVSLKHEFTTLPEKIKKLPLYKQAPQELDALIVQLNAINDALEKANIFKPNQIISVAHTSVLDKIVRQNLAKSKSVKNASVKAQAPAVNPGGRVTYTQVSRDNGLVPTHKAPQNAASEIQKYMQLPIPDVALRTKSALSNVQDSLSQIMTLLYTYQMPDLNLDDFKRGAYGGQIIELPVLLHNKNGRITLNEMRAVQKVDNPILVGINDTMGRAWTFKDVVHTLPKACSEQKLTKALSKYTMNDHGYSFLVISKQGPLTDDEVAETTYMIKTQIRAAMEKSLSDVQKNATRLSIYRDADAKKYIDALIQKTAAFEEAARRTSLLFDYSPKMNESLAKDEILNNINTEQTKTRVTTHQKGSKPPRGNGRVKN